MIGLDKLHGRKSDKYRRKHGASFYLHLKSKVFLWSNVFKVESDGVKEERSATGHEGG